MADLEPTAAPGAGGEDPWLTVGQISDELQIHPATVRLWIKTGRLSANRVRRTWRVRRSEMQRALRAGASRPPTEPGPESPAPVQGQSALAPTAAPRTLADRLLVVSARPGGQ
jgi:excisionase family DNA binding protein